MDAFTIRRLEKILNGYIEAKVPRDVRSSVRLTYEWSGKGVTLSEERPDDRERKWLRSSIAYFRLEHGLWSVFAPHREQWVAVASIAPHPDFERQLEQVERDPEGVFWIS